jgi:hypothetical protein
MSFIIVPYRGTRYGFNYYKVIDTVKRYIYIRDCKEHKRIYI